MHMMALITGMGNLDLLTLQMLRHDNRLDNLPRSGLDSSVMAPQAQHLDFFPLFNRKFSIHLTRFHVISVRTVAELA